MSGSPNDAANCVDGTHCIACRSSTPGRCFSVTLDETITKSTPAVNSCDSGGICFLFSVLGY